jgi:hypothetical protein
MSEAKRGEVKKRCIFCGRAAKMTDEHIWGDWTRSYVVRTSKKHDFAAIGVPKPGKPDAPKVRIRAGDPLNSQVRVVCGSCNSGWMGRLQNMAKPFLIPLFNGNTMLIGAEGQTTIAAWIAMATITAEHLSRDPRQITISQSERDWLMQNQTAPSEWRIWIGRYQRRSWPRQWVRATFPILDSKVLPEVVSAADRLPNTQTTAFVVGKLFVFAMSGPFRQITRGWDWRSAPAGRSRLQQIWPVEKAPIYWPAGDMTDTDAESIATAFVRYSDDLASRVGYR